jgi:hypothetical protein
MTVEIHLDSSPLATGTAKATGAVLADPGADFKSCGIVAGLYIENETDGSHGAVSEVTENTVTGTLSGGTVNGWIAGDTYNIYKTATKNAEISRIYTDRRFGTKVFRRGELNEHGNRHKDGEDLDANDENVFGPGQPWRRA